MNAIRWHFARLACVCLVLNGAVAAAAGPDEARPVEVVYTKWVDTVTVPGVRLLRGFAGGDVVGDFSGQVMVREVSYDGRIIRLEAEYVVEDGDHSFTALIRGGTNNGTGHAILDGVVLRGWRTGAAVHVEFDTIAAPSPNEPACQGHPPGLACFAGSIRIGRLPGR